MMEYDEYVHTVLTHMLTGTVPGYYDVDRSRSIDQKSTKNHVVKSRKNVAMFSETQLT